MYGRAFTIPWERMFSTSFSKFELILYKLPLFIGQFSWIFTHHFYVVNHKVTKRSPIGRPINSILCPLSFMSWRRPLSILHLINSKQLLSSYSNACACAIVGAKDFSPLHALRCNCFVQNPAGFVRCNTSLPKMRVISANARRRGETRRVSKGPSAERCEQKVPPPNEGLRSKVRGIFCFRSALCPTRFSLLRLAPCQENHLPELLRPGMLRIGEDGRPLDEARLL